MTDVRLCDCGHPVDGHTRWQMGGTGTDCQECRCRAPQAVAYPYPDGVEYPDCATCEEKVLAPFRESDPVRYMSRRMIVCPTCGNKRCPKATWHENACTGSNEPGQRGSRDGGR